MPIDWNIVDDDEASVQPTTPSGALDARRIHAIVLERRAAHRARLRAVLMPIACAAVAAMAATRAWSLHATRPAGAMACAAIGVAAAGVGARAIRRVRTREAERAVHEATPDFNLLSDARSPAERLEQLGR